MASTALTTIESGEIDTTELKKESVDILKHLLVETDPNKVKDMTYLFNQNQTKKIVVRQNKLNDLLDIITKEEIRRLTAKPDEISNKELLEGMRTVSDLIDKGQKQITSQPAQPLIQINTQNNYDGSNAPLSKESRDKVTSAVKGLLKELGVNTEKQTSINEQEKDAIIEAENRELIKEVLGDKKDD